MEDLETLRLLFESQGVHFREGDLADLDNNDDDQNQNQNQNQSQNQNQNKDNSQNGNTEQPTQEEPENPMAAEVDSGVDSADQVATNVQLNQDRAAAASTPTPMEARGQVQSSPSTLQLADGTDSGIAVDTSNQVDALDPEGTASISFNNGNYNELSKIPNQIAEKSTTISRTIIPLIQVALIELLGNNKAYVGDTFNSTFTMEGNTPIFNVDLTFKVDGWIGNDVALSSISEDAKYVLNRINVVEGVHYTKCEIDCNTGNLNIAFSY